MDYITIYDYLLLPVYLSIFYFLVVIKSRKYEGADLRKYLVTGFLLHMAGSILYCLVIQYYYGYGDSFGFFQGSNFLRRVISTTGDPFSTIFMSSKDFEETYAAANTGDLTLPTGIDVDSNLTIMKISAALSYITFNSYLIISLFFGLFSFTGLWKLFKTLNEIMGKKAERLLAFAILYMPSICFWGSGLIKDSVCLGAIGFIVHYLHNIFVKRKFRYREPMLVLVMAYLLFVIKSYIAVGLILSVVLAYVINIILRSKKNLLKLMFVSFILLISATIVIASLSSTLNSIVDSSKNDIEAFKGAYDTMDEEDNGSGFSATEVDISVTGIILKSPYAVFTTLFRPFVWEIRKPIMAFSALESFLALLATIYVLIKCRGPKFFYYIFTDPYIFFAFTFSMILAVIIGLSTFNFGTLVRYRLPALPFYFFMLLFIFVKNKEARQQK